MPDRSHISTAAYIAALSEEDRQFLRRANPHVAQLDDVLVCDTPPIRYLHEHPEKEAYRPRSEPRSTCHWGQRKLLIAELDFLLDHDHLFEHARQKHIVYAGAAAGTHIEILAKLWPDVLFHLFDTNPFDQALNRFGNIRLYPELFTDEIAEHFSALRNLIFFSDIRSGSEAMEDAAFEARVDADNQAQLQWCRIMSPLQSLLKFRLPFDREQYRYAAGNIYLPVWGPVETCETRLVPNLTTERIYDRDYESAMYYFNRYTRAAYYRNMPAFPATYCKCFDCSREIITLMRLMKRHPSKTDLPTLSRHISKILVGDHVSVVQYGRSRIAVR